MNRYEEEVENMKEQGAISSVYMIQYYNVSFYLFVKTDKEAFRVETLGRYIEGGIRMGMRGIRDWCTNQQIKYIAKFKYRKDYPIKANIWNFYSYCRFKLQRCQKEGVRL